MPRKARRNQTPALYVIGDEKLLPINKNHLVKIYPKTGNQSKTFQAYDDGFNLVLCGSAGTGKEQPVSEPVLTPNGWSTMGEVRPGDYVIGSSGTPIKVLDVYPQGVKDVYTVKTTDGVQIRAGADHLWSVWRNSHGKRINQIKTTQELVNIGIHKNSGDPKYTLPKFSGLQGYKKNDFGYALGYCLGNACFTKSTQLQVSYDDRIKDKLLPLLEPSLGTPTNSRNNGGYSGQSLYAWAKIHPEIAKYRDSGLSGDKWLHKDHQDWLLWDYESRLELLCGLLDSDGCTGLSKTDGRQRSRFTSTSINLICLVRDLIRSLGGRACEPVLDNREYKSGYCGNIAFRMPVCPFKLKAEQWTASQFSMQSTISSIVKEDYQEESVCIRVDAEDSLYVTTGFKLTHNTFSAIYLALCDVLDTSTPYEKIVVVRSTVPTRNQGFLPGLLEEKEAVYELPYKAIVRELIVPSITGDIYEKLKVQKSLEFISTSYVRGITIDNSIIVVDEFSNLSIHELDSIITRIGKNCKIIFSGDSKQSDLGNDKYEHVQFMRILENMQEFRSVLFGVDDIVRSKLVKSYLIQKDKLGY